jgi:NADPH:quinone reductase-like Zn-dependent oxidoreductase
MKYKRIVVRQYGGPDVLEFEEVEARNPNAGECRVRVMAASIARSDIMMRLEKLGHRTVEILDQKQV